MAKNRAEVIQDNSAKIISKPKFTNLNRENNTLLKLLEMEKFNAAQARLKLQSEFADAYQNQAFKIIKNIIESKISQQLGDLKQLQESGDRYMLFQEIRKLSPKFKGIEDFQKLVEEESAKGRIPSKTLAAAKNFYSTLERLKKKRTKFDVQYLEKISKAYPKTIYAAMSDILIEILSEDLNAYYDLDELRFTAKSRL